MWLSLVSLLPDMLNALDLGITGRACKSGLVTRHSWNPRDFTTNRYHKVDDRPYGGGPGMVMLAEPLQAAIQAAQHAAPAGTRLIWLTPQGKHFNQAAAADMATASGLIFVAGRYEGIDARLPELLGGEEWSLGDFILSGGELAALTMMDAIIRLLPGALGHAESAVDESLHHSLLEYPHYTRPEIFNGLKVPAVLLSGDHKAITRWRLQQSLGRTWLRRPDLLAQKTLTAEEQELLAVFIRQHNERSG